MDNFIVYQSKSKQLSIMFLAIVMLVIGAFLLFFGITAEESVNWLCLIIGIVSVVFFGYCLFFILKELFVGKEIVVVNKEGFYDRSSALSKKSELIKWEAVESIKIVSVTGQQFVSIYLIDSDAYLKSISGLRKKAVQANLKLGTGHININMQSAKNVSIEELYDVMNEFCLTYSKKA
ncbi:STM3941 family protein [Clostridium senegalense]|uniref:STM3941 family protein n=1 Tax=Clostridium senegalense TaxID=1465809 RepID=UPI000289D3DF|nr:STM3941 family protein [Clostridium senegalense]